MHSRVYRCSIFWLILRNSLSLCITCLFPTLARQFQWNGKLKLTSKCRALTWYTNSYVVRKINKKNEHLYTLECKFLVKKEIIALFLLVNNRSLMVNKPRFFLAVSFGLLTWYLFTSNLRLHYLWLDLPPHPSNKTI